jgi:glycosyltransferase involved in cell wall biosynthesis
MNTQTTADHLSELPQNTFTVQQLTPIAKDHVTIVIPQQVTTPKVGVVIPALNEEKNIEDVICRLKDLGFYNLLVIDGQSKDNTIEVAQKNGAKVIVQEGRGKGRAIRQVLNNDYFDVDALVLMDADGSMRPEEIPAFIAALNSGADVVKGSRFLKGGYTYDMSAVRRFGNMVMISVVNLVWSAKYTDLCYGFVVLNKLAVKKLAPLLESESFEIETELFIKALQAGLVVKEVPSTEFTRKNGASNLNAFRDGLKIFRRIAREIIYP